MKTFQRLDEAYSNARVEPFDDSSKYVFFSDCHRGDGSPSDEFTKNQNIFLYALEYYYKNDYTYVEVGDGDELWEQPKHQYIKNAHHDVFESLKKFHYHDRMIMLYGNHNIFLKDEHYVKNNFEMYYNDYRQEEYDFFRDLKAYEALVLRHRETNQEILVLHGHQGDFANDQFWYFTMLTVKYFWRFMHSFGIRSPASPAKNAHKRHKIERNFIKWIYVQKKAIICGHTHRFKFPRNGELPYINTGSCVYPTTITAVEINNGLLQIVRWKTRINKLGLLQTRRYVIRGPKPIKSFDTRDPEAKESGLLLKT